MKKVLIGCAVVFGFLLLLGVGSGFYIYNKFQSAVGDRAAHKAVDAQLEQRDGLLSSQVLPLDGVPSPESLAAYVTIARELSPRFEAAGNSLVGFFLRMNEKQNPLRKVMTGVRGSVGMTREISSLTARVDSLLLSTGIREADLAYAYALHRFGLMAWEAPDLEAELDDQAVEPKAKREASKAVAGVESEIEAGLVLLMQRQLDAIAALASPTPEQQQCRVWLESLLDARSLFDALRTQGLSEQQRAAFASVDFELRALVPQSAGAYFLELLSLGVDSDDDSDSVSFSYSSD